MFETDALYAFRLATLHETIEDAKDTDSKVFIWRGVPYLTATSDLLLAKLAEKREEVVEAERVRVEKMEKVLAQKAGAA